MHQDKPLRFSIYGRFVLEMVREHGRWTPFRVGDSARRREPELVIPSDLDASEVPGFLDDIYHELARPGETITRLD